MICVQLKTENFISIKIFLSEWKQITVLSHDSLRVLVSFFLGHIEFHECGLYLNMNI